MRAALAVLLALGTLACQAADEDGAAGASAPLALASSDPLPARFGFGRPATPGEIERLDIDVMPDGRGLPAGQGTAVQGAGIYAAKCAVCHGAQGEGTPIGAALVGREGDPFDSTPDAPGVTKTIGNYWPHATTLFDYIRRAMPGDRPGTLTDDEVYALSAYLLARNQIIAEDAVMDARSLPQVRMPARDRFVPDDREETNRVR